MADYSASVDYIIMTGARLAAARRINIYACFVRARSDPDRGVELPRFVSMLISPETR